MARAKGNVTKGNNFAKSVGVQVQLEGLEETLVHLAALEEAVSNPAPALQMVAGLFEAMEKQRFASGGAASTFGISQRWEPLTQATVERRTNMGGNPNPTPLLNLGYLAQAATKPYQKTFGSTSLDLVIDPRHAMEWAPRQNYSGGIDYGSLHQRGEGRPKREFVTITPEFREMAAFLVDLYIATGQKQAIKNAGANKDFGYAKRTGRYYRRKYHLKEKQRLKDAEKRATEAKAKVVSINKSKEKDLAKGRSNLAASASPVTKKISEEEFKKQLLNQFHLELMDLGVKRQDFPKMRGAVSKLLQNKKSGLSQKADKALMGAYQTSVTKIKQRYGTV